MACSCWAPGRPASGWHRVDWPSPSGPRVIRGRRPPRRSWRRARSNGSRRHHRHTNKRNLKNEGRENIRRGSGRSYRLGGRTGHSEPRSRATRKFGVSVSSVSPRDRSPPSSQSGPLGTTARDRYRLGDVGHGRSRWQPRAAGELMELVGERASTRRWCRWSVPWPTSRR